MVTALDGAIYGRSLIVVGFCVSGKNMLSLAKNRWRDIQINVNYF